MRKHYKIFCFALGMFLLLFLFPQAGAQNYFEYNVQVDSDGSGVWVITQFSSVDSPTDSWQGFQEKIFPLVNAASALTGREMEISEDSVQISNTISSASRITEYAFVWENFSIVNGDELRFGDVFQVDNFFSQLYGDAALELRYPSDFIIKSVSPLPNEQQDSTQTLRWARTLDLANGASVVLTRASSNGLSDGISLYELIVVALAVGVTVLLLGFFAVKRRRNEGKNASTAILEASPIESEEDKVLKLLKSSGGSMRQSEITERCRFSKAKTSQLLSALENSGVITRYKKGRDKIVTLKERVTGE